jgi:hypothetical protein
MGMKASLAAIGLALAAVPPSPVIAGAATCDAQCLDLSAAQLTAALRTGKLPAGAISRDAEIRENGQDVAFGATIWRKVRNVRSTMTFTDPLTGNAIVRSGVELADGKPAYLSTRLRRAPSGRIVDIEIAADTGPMVVADYVWNLDPIYGAPVALAQRSERSAIEAIIRRYFNALGTHQAVRKDIDDAACDRYHSGTRITNVAVNGIEGGAMRTCASAMEGALPWGPASEQRVPVIDVERGIAVGITLLHYPAEPGQPTMYVTEVFKIVAGRIVRIDNIGLKQGHRASLGFVH